MSQVKQISSILEEVNYNGPRPRLVKCIGAHNEEGWIEYNLRNNYDEFDEIRVVEGAVVGRPFSTPEGRSTDKTLELIKNFPDPQDKIRLFTLDRPFKCLEEQKQIFLDTSQPGDWLFIVDCDEFYRDGDITRIRKAIELHPTASEFIPTFLHFYRDFWHIRDFEGEWNLWHQRIIRYQSGMRYHTHPVATDSNGLCTYFAPEYQHKRYTIPGLYIYHYGHAKSSSFHKMKAEFYHLELAKFPAQPGKTAADAFDQKLSEFVNYNENLNSVLEFNIDHPIVMKSHPTYEYKEPFYVNKKFKIFKTSRAYSELRLPTIPQWMMFSKKMFPVYNII